MVGSTWTIDARVSLDYRSVGATKLKGILAVEMEAASLYAFIQLAGARLYCVAHVNMGQGEAHFEKAKTMTSTITHERRRIIVLRERRISFHQLFYVCNRVRAKRQEELQALTKCSQNRVF